MNGLVIGIGGVGKVILMRLRQMIVEEFGELQSGLDFLHIDTYINPDQEADQNFAATVLGKDITFGKMERLSLATMLPRPPASSRLIDHPSIQAWFPPDLPVNINFSDGAGGIRPFGRLALHYNVQELRNKLNALLSRQGSSGNDADIYIVSSFFGGTGSGSFLDACYIARDEKENLGINGAIKGFFIVGASNPNAVMKANCYAALMELEHYTTEHLNIRTGNLSPDHKVYQVEFPQSGVGKISSGLPPVDTCYIIGANNGRKTFNRTDLEEMTARRIFLETFPPIKGAIQAQQVDGVQTNEFFRPDTAYGRAKTFFSTSCSSIEFPAPRLMNGLAAAFSAYCCQHLLYKKASGLPDVKGTINDILESRLGVRISEDSLRKEFEKQQTTTITQSMREDRLNWLQSLKTTIASGNLEARNVLPEAEQYFTRAKNEVTEDRAAYPLAVRTNMDLAWSTIEGRIEEEISSFVENPAVGPIKTVELLKALNVHLEAEKDRLSKNLENSQRELPYHRHKVKRRLNRINEDQVFRWEITKHCTWYCTKELAVFMDLAMKANIYEAIITLIKRVIQKVETKKQELSKYIEKLEVLTSFYLEEGKKIFNNLRQWIRGEGDEYGSYLSNLEDFLSVMESLSEVGQLEALMNSFAANYNLEAPFGSDIDGAVREVIGGLAQNPYPHMLEKDSQFQDGLFMGCRRIFQRIGSINICDFLINNSKMSKAELHKLFEKKIDDSHWCLQVDTNDPDIGNDPNLHQKHWVGVPQSIDLVNHDIWNGPLGSISFKFQGINEPYRMVFITELSNYCMRNIMFLGTYAEAYRRVPHGERATRHIDRTIEFQDIMPDRERDRLVSEVEELEVVARALGILKEDKDPESNYPAIYLYYTDPSTNMPMNQKVAPAWEEVVTKLVDDHKNGNRQNPGNTESGLEKIRREIKTILKKAEKKEDKENLVREIKAYQEMFLDQMEGEREDKVRHAKYQKIVQLTSDFIKKNNLPAVA